MDSHFLDRSRYYLTHEYPVKIRHALREVPGTAVWRRENDSSNSIGNLLVHLTGNIRQWIVGGLGGLPVERDRASEFARCDGPDSEILMLGLESVIRDADSVLATLSEHDLVRPFTIQGRETTGLAAIYHVVEHFAMHTGQIILLAKLHAPGRIRFYEDAGGRAIPIWGGNEGTSAASEGRH